MGQAKRCAAVLAISLSVNAAVRGDLLWTGAADNQWNSTSLDWLDRSTNLPAVFSSNKGVAFDDSSLQNAITVTGVQNLGNSGAFFYNDVVSYVLAGPGDFNASVGDGLSKSGVGQVSLA